MKKVLILGRKTTKEKNDVAALVQALSRYSDKDMSVHFSYFENTLVICDHTKTTFKAIVDTKECALEDFDLVIQIGWSHDRLYSDLAHVIARQAAALSVDIWNSELINARSMTKLSQLTRTLALGIPIPKTIFSLNKRLLLKAFDESGLEFPVIAKDPTASRGRRNYLIADRVNLKKILAKPDPLLLQSFIENDSSDIRIITAEGKPVFAFSRIGNNGSHLNNISAGGKAEIIKMDKLPKKLVDYSIRITQEFDRELCGIDFMFDTRHNRFVFLEVNLTPQLVNGVFVSEKMQAVARAIREIKE